jgi:hypothetical protein
VIQMETDLQSAYRLQKRLKELKEELEQSKIELDFCIERIKNSGTLSDGDVELVNKPKQFWEIDVNAVKEKYPLLIQGIVDKILEDADRQIQDLDKHLPVGLVKDAMKFYGVVDNYGNGDVSGLGTQVPKDQWVVLPVSKFSP